MTTTVKVHVNGNYRTTVVQTVEGEPGPRDPVVINPQEEVTIPFVHGKKNDYSMSEEYLGNKKE